MMASLYKDENGNWVPVPKPISLYHVVRGALLNALAYTNGHQKSAAGLLGISERQISYMLVQYDIPSRSKVMRSRRTNITRPRLKLVHQR